MRTRVPSGDCHQNSVGWSSSPRQRQALSMPNPLQDLRHLSDVTERVGHVADHHLGSEAARVAVTCQQVADVRFGADEEHVGQDVPGADQDASRIGCAASAWTRPRVA